jgi:hypothetical protein
MILGFLQLKASGQITIQLQLAHHREKGALVLVFLLLGMLRDGGYLSLEQLIRKEKRQMSVLPCQIIREEGPLCLPSCRKETPHRK